MGNIERDVRKLINSRECICDEMNTLEELEKSIKEFQDFIEQGIIKSRGYNLQTIEDCTFISRIFEFNFAQ